MLNFLTLLHSEWSKLYRVLAILSAVGFKDLFIVSWPGRSPRRAIVLPPASALAAVAASALAAAAALAKCLSFMLKFFL